MKTLVLILALCAHGSLLFGQDVIRFTREGKIANGSTLPSAFNDSILLDLSAIKAPKSDFNKQLDSLISKAGQAEPDPRWAKFYPNKLTLARIREIRDSNAVLVYPSDGILPFKAIAPGATGTLLQNGGADPSEERYLNPVGQLSEYKIWKENFDFQIINRHLEKTRIYYKGFSRNGQILLDSLRNTYETSYAVAAINYWRYLDSLRACESGSLPTPTFQIGLIHELSKIYRRVGQTNDLFCSTLEANGKWIRSWMWLTGGEVRLNPFPVFDPRPLIRKTEERLAYAEKQLSILDNYAACCQFGQMPFDTTVVKSRVLTNQINSLKRQRDDLTGLIKVYEKWVATVSINKQLLYSGVIPVSTSKHIRWAHHYDAADKFRFMTAAEQYPASVAPMDELLVLIHNVKSSDSLSLKVSEEKFEPETKLKSVIDPFSDALATAFKAAGPVGIITSLISGLSPGPPKVPQNVTKNAARIEAKGKKKIAKKDKEIHNAIKKLTYEQRENFINPIISGKLGSQGLRDSLKMLIDVDKPTFVLRLYTLFGVEDMLDYEGVLNEYLTSLHNLNWLLQQTTPTLVLKPQDETVADFSTVIEYPEKNLEIVGSKKINYQVFLNKNKEAEAKRSYTKYELARWWPTVGVAYIPANREASVFNDSTGTFATGNDFDNFEALVGVKWYFRKTNSARDNQTRRLIRGTFDWRANRDRGNSVMRNSLFLTGGLGIRHKFLRNYYLGLGGDITPGLSFLAGFNFIFQKRYELENNAIKNELDRPKPFLFVGISVDPNIVTNLINIFL